jgi:DNA-binding NarL/FixJ family response regulator
VNTSVAVNDPPVTNAVRVLIVDDHPVVREGLRAMLKAPGVTVVGDARSGSEAVSRVRELQPDVVLMDVKMPDMDGIAATEAIKNESPSTAVIIITSFEAKDYLRLAIEAGAVGYLVKGASRDTVIRAIKAVNAGESSIDASLLAELVASSRPGERSDGEGDDTALSNLSPRELEALKLLSGGLTNKEIAQRMNYSVGTVKNVVQRIIGKLGVSDRTQAAVHAVRAGLDVD